MTDRSENYSLTAGADHGDLFLANDTENHIERSPYAHRKPGQPDRRQAHGALNHVAARDRLDGTGVWRDSDVFTRIVRLTGHQ